MESMSGQAAPLPVELPRRGGLLPFGDARLARLAARGDRRALEAIFRRHHQELYRYCRAIVRDPHDAEDALQATMMKIAAALPGETREISLRPWLFRIAHNEAISVLRARRPTADLDQQLPADGEDVELQAEQRDRLRRLIQDLDGLPARQRGALIMRELSGFSFAEVGAAFAISAEAAKQAVYEARVALQEISEGREMDCRAVRRTISDGDRRRLRGRRVRAHLSDCERCADFAAAIDRRRADLSALAPPIAAPAALAALHAAAGASATGAATGAGVTLAGSAAIKSAVAVVAAVAITGGGAEVGRLVGLGGSGDRGDHGVKTAPAQIQRSAPATRSPADTAPQPVARPADDVAAGSRTPSGEGKAKPSGGHRNSAGVGHDHPSSGGATPAAPAEHAPAGPSQSSTPPGQAAEHAQGFANGQSTGSSQSVAHSNPRAQANSSSAIHSQASDDAHGGGTATAPGQTDTAGHSPNGNAYGELEKNPK
jgi:RNA polymerase sigma factor (sigma-70 family)